MRRALARLLALQALWMHGACAVASARPAQAPHEFSEPHVDLDIVGDVNGVYPPPRKVQPDTIWIVDWSFDTGSPCDDGGWTNVDNRILNDGRVFWNLDASFDGTGDVRGNAAALGYDDELCCYEPTGYDNDWYQAIRIEYVGAGEVVFDYLIDSEEEIDYMRVESDSACASFERVDYDAMPNKGAAAFRDSLFQASGVDFAGVASARLPDYGPGTHCLFIAFFSDGAWSPCDGLHTIELSKPLVIDNIVVTDESGVRSDDFSAGSIGIGSFVNIQDATPFGEWARLYRHITDNDRCTENTTCAWLWTDDDTPTIANDPSMGFAPGGFVIRNWLDNSIVSSWVSLVSTPEALGTILQFRRFPGNFFSTSRIVQNWSVRGKVDTDDGMGGTLECISGWRHAYQWNSLSFFGWITPTASGNPPASGYDMSHDFDPDSREIQVRHRTADWQRIAGVEAPEVFMPGPGPFIDRTRIGRILYTGPSINEGVDARRQAQDAFPTELDPTITPGTGEHFRATTDRFGTCAFSGGTDLGRGVTTPNLVTTDSIVVRVQDVRNAGGIAAVELYGAIVAGPHAGKAPPPWAVQAHGFFVVPADSVRNSVGTVVRDNFFVDLDDFYFRGGDVLHYFWLATDALAGMTSNPVGLSRIPDTVEEAELETRGMFEVSYLPDIDWDPAYLARIATDPHGDLDPTSSEIANSTQASCILYVNRINSRRRSGDPNRTSFMYTLDRLGYRGRYDVYDHTGMGNTNNHLGGRATVQQAQGYSLIVYDAGNVGPGGTIMPSGRDWDAERIDQATWFRIWLAQATLSEAGSATLWVIGSNALEERPDNPLYASDMGATLTSSDQNYDLSLNPDVEGQTSFTFQGPGASSCSVDFAGRLYSLNGGCPSIRKYDGMSASGSAVVTHRYRHPWRGTSGEGAIVMNSNAPESWNTILQAHAWGDIRDPERQGIPSAPTVQEALLDRVLGCVLPRDCQVEGPAPTDAPNLEPDTAAQPRVTMLVGNQPNPFNATTTIRFDVASEGHVSLIVYDVAGRLVRTLVNGVLEHQRHSLVWDGLDRDGRRVPSGVYFYRLEAAGFSASKRMVVIE